MIKNKYTFLYVSLICTYSFYMIWMGLHTEALVPDEVWFLNVVHDSIVLNNFGDVVSVPNYLGYGAIYWIVLKLLESFALMRFVSVALMISVLCAVLVTVRAVVIDPKVRFLSMVFCISAPMTWFTGKMIGPEILGYAVGVWGCVLGFVSYKCQSKRKKMMGIFLAGILLGCAAGIKLNYFVFLLFLDAYIVIHANISCSDNAYCWKKRLRVGLVESFGNVLCLMLGATAGSIIANPIMLYDFHSFIGQFDAGGYSIRNLVHVLNREYIEWDLVNSGGMNKTIASVIVTIFVIVLGITNKNKEIKSLALSGCISICVLIGLCCKERFLGWYLMPIIFITAVCVSDMKIMPILIILNLMVMFPNVSYQIKAKEGQIDTLRHRAEIESYMEQYNSMYEDYAKYYFIEQSMGLFPAYMYEGEETDFRLIYISEPARANKNIDAIYTLAQNTGGGYKIVDKQYNVTVITYEKMK